MIKMFISRDGAAYLFIHFGINPDMVWDALILFASTVTAL
jgi:hypothetical protein